MNFTDVPMDFIDKHLSQSQKELIKTKYKIYLDLLKNQKLTCGQISERYNLSKPRSSEIKKELIENRRIRQL